MDYKPNQEYIWTKTYRDDILVPHSELAMHVGAAGCPIYAFARTSNNYCHIIYIKDGCNKSTHGLITEVIPYQSDLYYTCMQSHIVNAYNLYPSEVK